MDRVDVDVEVEGDIEIEAALDKVNEGLSQNEIMTALMQTGFMFEEQAKWYASGNMGGPQVRTGNLRASIQTEPNGHGGVQVAPHTEYAYFVEMGTSRSAPYPYMRPAYETTLEDASKFLSDRIGDDIEIRFNQ